MNIIKKGRGTLNIKKKKRGGGGGGGGGMSRTRGQTGRDGEWVWYYTHQLTDEYRYIQHTVSKFICNAVSLCHCLFQRASDTQVTIQARGPQFFFKSGSVYNVLGLILCVNSYVDHHHDLVVRWTRSMTCPIEPNSCSRFQKWWVFDMIQY